MSRIIKYIFYDLLRTRFILLYLVFLLISTLAMFQLDSDPGKVTMSLLNILLMIVPLVSIIFTTIHFYNSYEFMELMLAQPVNRKTVLIAQYIGVSVALAIAFLIGVGGPLLIFGGGAAGTSMILSGIMLTLVFVSLAFLASVLTSDKAKAIGGALLLWFYFSLIYDAFILWVVYNFGDYPLEKPILVLISLNPVDLARVMMLMKMDISALMGYTGAFYRQFFSSSSGILFSVVVLVFWIVIPFYCTLKVFVKKDI
ncbi:MAG: ABC transporter permease subunit [Saprospiraceae bacterium]|nr:ABC transporter permease subunit [Saprospiraceae bacterium]